MKIKVQLVLCAEDGYFCPTPEHAKFATDMSG